MNYSHDQSSNLIAFLELVFTTVTLFISTGGLTTLNPKITQLLWFSVYVIMFVSLFIRIDSYVTQIRKIKLYFLLLMLCIISIIWTASFYDTMEGIIKFLGTFLFSIYFYDRFSNTQRFRILTLVFTICIILSYAFGLFFKDYGVMTGFHEGDWKGIFAHKNNLGKIMSLATIFFFINMLKNKTKRVYYLILFILAFGLVILSGSKTALIVTILILPVPFLVKFLKINQLILIPYLMLLSSIFIASIYLITNNYNKIVLSLGRNPELTGRTELWELTIEMIKQKPLLGYGYSGFWTGYNGPSARIWYITGWEPPHAHNGFIDIALQVGIVGLVLFCIMFLNYTAKALKRSRYYQDLTTNWSILFLIFTLFINLTETSFLKENNILNILLIVTMLFLKEKDKQNMIAGEDVEGSNMRYYLQTSRGIKKITNSTR